MGIVFRSGTKPDSLQENAWDVHNKSKNITEEGIKAAKHAEATIPYNKKNVLGLVEAHEQLAPVLDKYKHEARTLERENKKRIVERQIRNSQVREKNIQTRLNTDLKNLQSLQNIVTSTLGIARDVDKINRINAIERRDELTSIADRASLSYEKLVKHKTGSELLTELEQSALRKVGEARKNGLSELDIDKLLQPGGYYIRDAFTTQQAYRTAETFPGWVASISEKKPTELFSDSERGRGSLKANSYAQAKAKYANDNSVANAADLNAWQSAIENLFFEQNFKGTLIEGKFNLVTSNLFADTRDRVGTEGVVSAQKKLPQRKGLERTTVSNVRIQNYLNAGRQVSTWKEGDDPNKRFEFARDIPEAMGWDFEQQTRFTNNGSTGHEKRVNWMQDISRLGLKGDLT